MQNKFYILQQLMRFKGLPPSARVVGYEIVNHWNYKTKSCYPSQEYLSGKLHVSTPTVKRAVKLLEECNIIKVERVKGMSNRYMINFVEMTWKSPPKKMIPVSPVIPKPINISTNIDTSINTNISDVHKGDKVDRVDVLNIINRFRKNTNSNYVAVKKGLKHRRNSLADVVPKVRKRLSYDRFLEWYKLAYSDNQDESDRALRYAREVLAV